MTPALHCNKDIQDSFFFKTSDLLKDHKKAYITDECHMQIDS